MSKTARFVILLVTVAISAFFLWPTISWYCIIPERDKNLLKLSPEQLDTKSVDIKKKVVELKNTKKRSLNLGLDLQGGANLILAVDETELSNQMKNSKDEYKKLYTDAVDRALLVLRNRMNSAGISEITIQKRFDQKISIELPGVNNPQMIRESLNKVGKLEFKVVDEASMKLLLASNVINTEGHVSSSNSLPSWFEIPEESEWAPYYTNDQFGVPQLAGGYILKKKVEMDGTMVRTARSTADNYGRPDVNFELTEEGAEVFKDVTERNVKNRLAIVLDGKVKSAPVIQGVIAGGSGQITGNFSMEETVFLANILKSGSLPVKLKIVEEKLIGPSLGRDSINSGLLAIFVGAVLVVLFMMVYYKFSGIISVVALSFHMLYMMSFLSYMGATMTLAGIAGIGLTIGMAVDANVLIYERIREELRRSRLYRHAMENGFEAASATIFDTNITTLIAALALTTSDIGSIKGFGLFLAVGIVFNVFAALFISRLVFDWLMDTFKFKKISV